MRAPLRAIVGAVVTVAYPALVYVAVTRWGARAAGLLILALVIPRATFAALGRGREHLLHVLRVPATIALLAGLSALLRDARFVLAMPTLVNLALLAHFALSLRSEVPIVERFARMQASDLSEAERAWCRAVTVAWCVFFACNALASALLALAAPIAWWTLYTAVLSYVFMAAMFTVEYVLRSYRFRRYGDALHERIMARVFPPRAAR